jgi:hypothetical protein
LALKGRGVSEHYPVLFDDLCSKLGDQPGVDPVRLGATDQRNHPDAAAFIFWVGHHLRNLCNDHVDFGLIDIPGSSAVR